MAGSRLRLLDQLRINRSMQFWSGLAQRAGKAPPSDLNDLRSRAKAMRNQLDRLIATADVQMQPSRPAPELPAGAGWAWRPDLWQSLFEQRGWVGVATGTRLSPDITLFHDCTDPQFSFRQMRDQTKKEACSFALAFEAYRCGGSFVSLVIELPRERAVALGRDHLLRLELSMMQDAPMDLFTRLNIQHGPNTEQLVRAVPKGETETVVEFDLAYSSLNERRMERAWIDLIFECPDMNRIVLHDLTFARLPRANL